MGLVDDLTQVLSRGPSAQTSTRPAGRWYWPTRTTRVSQGVNPSHRAIDIPGRVGDPIYASTSGTISAVNNQPGGYGTNIRILTDQGQEIILGHLSGVNVRPGQRISAGQVVGLLGNTGRSTGPHLHFEVRRPGSDAFAPGHSSTRSALDPFQFFGGREIPNTPTPSLSTFKLSTGSPLRPAASLERDIMGASQPTPMSQPLKRDTRQVSQPVVFSTGRPAANYQAGTLAKDTRGGSRADDIRLAGTPLGDVTIAKPGAFFKKAALFAGASIVGAISLAALLASNKTVRNVASAAAKATPVGAGINAAVKGK